MRARYSLPAIMFSTAALAFSGVTSTFAAEPQPPTSAHSAMTPTAKSDCPAGSFCVWKDANYSDGPGKFAGDNADWTNFSHSSCSSGTWNNCASSGFNNGTSGLGVSVRQLVGGGGDAACLPRGWSLSDFSGYVWPGTSDSFNDSISANFWTSAC